LQVIALFILQKQNPSISPSRRRKSAEAERSDEYFEQQVQQVRKNSVFTLLEQCCLNVCGKCSMHFMCS